MPTLFTKPLPRSLLLLALVATLLQVFTVPSAARADDEPVVWSMSPADGSTADGRQWVELELRPGQSRTEHLVVKNHGNAEATFKLEAADGYFTETGRFNMLSADQQSVDAGTWITVPSDVTVAAGGSELVQFTVTVPENATPGDHAAGIASVITSSGTGSGGTSLGVESRVGFRVMTRVTGPLAPGLDIGEVAASYTPSWNPFGTGNIDITYGVQNSGNLQLETSSLASAPLAGGLHAPENISILPGTGTQQTLRLNDAWPIFLTPIELSVTGHDAQGRQQVVEQRTIWVATPPWAQLAVLAGLLLCLFGLHRRRAKRELQLQELLQAARRDGAREAAEAQTPAEVQR